MFRVLIEEDMNANLNEKIMRKSAVKSSLIKSGNLNMLLGKGNVLKPFNLGSGCGCGSGTGCGSGSGRVHTKRCLPVRGWCR